VTSIAHSGSGMTDAVHRRAGITLVFLQTLPTLAIAALVPVLPELFRTFAAVPHSALLVPMVLTLPALCVAIFSSLLGYLTDRYGRRRVLMPSLLAFAIFGLGPLLVEGLPAILATRFVVGIAEAGILTVGNSLMGDYFEGEERRHWLGRQTIVGPIASIVYVAVGGTLGGVFSWRAPFLLYLVGLAVLAAGIFTLPEPRRKTVAEHRTRDESPFPWRAAALVAVVTLFLSAVFFVQNVQHGRIFGDLGAGSSTRIAWLINAASIGSLLAGVTYRYVNRPTGWYFALIFFVYGVGYSGLALVPNYRVAVPFDGIANFGAGLSIPTLIAWTLSKFPEEHRGRGMGVWAASFFVGEFLSPLAMTLIGSPGLTFLQAVGVVGVVCLVSAGILALRNRRALAARMTGAAVSPSIEVATTQRVEGST
jgi:MFS family permease